LELLIFRAPTWGPNWGSQNPLVIDEYSVGDHIKTVEPIPGGATLVGFDEIRLDGDHPRELFIQGFVEDV